MKKVECSCGCGGFYVPNRDKPVKYKIISYLGNSDKEILEVKRLKDGMIFKLGDTVKRITKTGKKYRRFVIFKMEEIYLGLRILGYSVDRGGIVDIHNDKSCMKSAENPNCFRYIYK